MSASAPSSPGLSSTPPEDGKVYVDSDWIPPAGGGTPIPVLIFDPERGLSWPGGEWIAVPEGLGPDEAAAGLVEAHARAVVEAIPADGAVAVPGAGAVAGRIRALLGTRAAPDLTVRPAVVVETTGRAEGAIEATAGVDDLGCVLLAASPESGAVAVDLYQDVHRRGLRVLGIADPARPASGSHLPPPQEVTLADLHTAGPWSAIAGPQRA